MVGGWREERQDQAYRRIASRLHNRLTSMIVGVPMHDYGCMLRAYRRHIIDTVIECDEKAAFVPALANTFAKRVAEFRSVTPSAPAANRNTICCAWPISAST